jgi:hypothetical protein
VSKPRTEWRIEQFIGFGTWEDIGIRFGSQRYAKARAKRFTLLDEGENKYRVIRITRWPPHKYLICGK